jgi:hypothetical protein
VKKALTGMFYLDRMIKKLIAYDLQLKAKEWRWLG